VPPLPTGRSPLPGGVAAAAKLSKSLAPEGESPTYSTVSL